MSDSPTLQNTLNQPITFKSIRLIRLNLPQKEQFVSGIGVRNTREALIVEWTDASGTQGYGECSCRPDPYYSAEYLDGAILLVQQFVVPHLKAEQTLGELVQVLDKIRGWNFTKAAVEMAALQVIEKNTGHTPLASLPTESLAHVPVGISMGLFTDLEQMKTKVQSALDTGYKRLKFKIAPSVRIDFFEAVNPMMFDAGAFVTFDANGSFGANDLDTLAYFVRTYHTMVEQPFAPTRFDLLLEAKKQLPELFVCFDEEVKSLGDLVKLHHLGVLDELNLKPGRVGGMLKSIRIMEYCRTHNIPCWIGGMFETGIGRRLNLRIASHLPQAKAHDLSPSDRYFLEDVIKPGVQMTNGLVEISSLQHCQIQPKLLAKYTMSEHTHAR